MYILQPYAGTSSRYRCPACNHRHCFSRYIDTQTRQQLAPHAGRCNRQDKCGYHFTPRQFFSETRGNTYPGINRRQHYHTKTYKPAANKTMQPSFIAPAYVNRSFANYQNNHFVQYLIRRFGLEAAAQAVAQYRIGTSKYWPGATIFWQLDQQGNVRTGKIMLYNATTGKRVKEPFSHINWVHSLAFSGNSGNTADDQTKAFHLRQCLFGEHLLHPATPSPGAETPPSGGWGVAIVESEKTAIIASLLMPAFTWLACGSLTGLNPQKCAVLQGRQVILFPDANGYEQWQTKARELRKALPGTTIVVSQTLEALATLEQREQGVDLADVL